MPNFLSILIYVLIIMPLLDVRLMKFFLQSVGCYFVLLCPWMLVGWRNYSEATSTDCSWRGYGFHFKFLNDSSQLSLMLISKYLTFSSGPFGNCIYVIYRHTYLHIYNTHIHKTEIEKLKFKNWITSFGVSYD